MAKEAGMVCGTDGAWCEFCQRFHSSETCFHPGKQPMTEYERQYPLLKEENEKLKAQIADRKAVLKACSNRNEIIERRIAELGAIGPVHDSWNTSEDFTRGWDACRKLVAELLRDRAETDRSQQRQ